MGYAIFAENLKKTRKAKGFTQETIADASVRLNEMYPTCKLPVTSGGWASYESGRTEPSLEGLAKTAKLLGVSSDYLLDLSQEMQPQAKEFEQKTGLSELSVASLMSLSEDGKEMVDCLNSILESADFIRMIRHLMVARKINRKSVETEQSARTDEESYLFAITDGMDSDRAWFSDKRQIDMCVWQSLQIMNDLFRKILKEDKNNGECNEEN